MTTEVPQHGLAYRIVRGLVIAFGAVLLVFVLVIAAAIIFPLSKSDHVKDEALQAGRQPDTFRAADDDYYHDMDGGKAHPADQEERPFSADEMKGRNNWIVWTGGNDRFWDIISVKSVGTLDFLKTISSAPGLQGRRDNRWNYYGLVNEPCYEKATGPDPNRFGLWLDKYKQGPGCLPDPFEKEDRYPGVKIGGRGKTVWKQSHLPVGSYYGYATGIVGLRLFPNPDFDEKASAHWDPVRYYNDPTYYNDRTLVKPYRVGMSCGFCHVGPNPLKPPADPNNPKWENLSSMVGAQYFWIDRIFDWHHDPSSFIFQLFHTSRPGTLDTSLVSTDNINNPRTMNAVYNLMARLDMASKWGQEKLAGGELNNKQFNNYVPAKDNLAKFFKAPDMVWTPHVLKDGADSVGALGALNRVYLNIGLFSEEWLEHFNPLVGGKKVTPIEIAVAEKNSTYWKANENQTFYLAQFMLASTAPHPLAKTPEHSKYLTTSKEQLTHGKIVFAERCARCHSSKLPDMGPSEGLANCAGKDYLNCFKRYWKLTQTEDFKAKMRSIVLKDDFLKDNFLSTDARIPVTLLQTNACSPLATNALANNIWDNFSSQSYKDLPSVGSITVLDPYSGTPHKYEMPAGGRGYTRPPSLVSLWSTAPFLLNNTVGHFEPEPSVDARMKSFNDSITQMLWPEKRAKDSDQKAAFPDGVLLLNGPGPSLIDRTTQRTYLNVSAGYLPAPLSGGTELAHRLLPKIFSAEGIQIGPIPAGTPVNLLANLNLMSDSTNRLTRLKNNVEVAFFLWHLKHDLAMLPDKPTDDQVRQAFAKDEPKLIYFNKCPDFIVNKGHYFGTNMLVGTDDFAGEPGLSDEEKMDLIEFLKTF